jgi:DNA-directed RNA polymerase subunit RPC12/RpoP
MSFTGYILCRKRVTPRRSVAMANLWGNGKKSNTNKTIGYSNGKSARKGRAKLVPLLDEDFTQPDNVVESPVIETKQPAVVSHTAVNDKVAVAADSTTIELLRDGRVIKLIDALILGRINEITPAIDLSVKSGGHYPDIERLMDTSGEETADILEKLADEGILHKKLIEKLHCDPDGSLQLLPVERCPRCGSGNLISGKLIEHFYCGNIGLEQEFKHDIKYVCSKCNRELKLLGTDYRYAGTQYKCLDCNDIFPAPTIKWRSLSTGKIWALEELHDVPFYIYSFNNDKKGLVEFQLKPKAQLIEFLKSQGYMVQELAQIGGGSGAIHTVDILASRDDTLAKFQVGIGILTALPGEEEVRLEELFTFDTNSYDIRIDYKCVIAIPRLSSEAQKFAGRQNIIVFETADLTDMMAFIKSQPCSKAGTCTIDNTVSLNNLTELTDTRGRLAAFLRFQGYIVTENAKLAGRSGVEYVFDLFAHRDDVIVRPAIAVVIDEKSTTDEAGISKIAQFDAATYDVGIRNKVFVGNSRMSPTAAQFARRQRMKFFDEDELDHLLHKV